MHDQPGARRTDRQVRRPHLVTRGSGEPQLVDAVLQASGGAWAELDERYLLHAFVVYGAGGRADTPIVVELIDHGPTIHGSRWQAMASDEFSGVGTELGQGATAQDALASLDWHALD